MTEAEIRCLVAGLAVVGIATANYWSATMRALRVRQQLLEGRLLSLSGGLEGVTAQVAGVATRAAAVERQTRLAAERLAVSESRNADRSFDQAIDSARRGADAGTLAVRFGLSRGEAELVARLHGNP
jgi:hypothetical protein